MPKSTWNFTNTRLPKLIETNRVTNVVLISSVVPNRTTAGNIVLHRHLVEQSGINLIQSVNRSSKWNAINLQRRAYSAASRLGFKEFAERSILRQRGRWYEPQIQDIAKNNTVVVTVAHGDLFYVAQSFAQANDLPLVTFFHDWWPEIPDVEPRFRKELEADFRQLYNESDLPLCVCPAMKEQLGEHPNAHVLYPIPARHSPTPGQTAEQPKPGRPFKIVYAGNLNDYGPMLADLMREIQAAPDLKLEVRGANPNWPDSFQNEMCVNKNWLPFVPRDEFERWMESADAFLIPQSFTPADRRKMETNFPSKIPEMAQYGKPLVIWGPAEASGAIWCSETGNGLNVTSSKSAEVIKELKNLNDNQVFRRRLADAARKSANDEFDPSRIRDQFLVHIKHILNSRNQVDKNEGQ